MKKLQEKVVEAAVPLSFALGVGLGVLGTLASPPLTGILYLAAVLMSAGVAYFLLGKRGWENESPKAVQRFDEERAYWHGEAERLLGPEHEDDGSASR